MFHYFFLFFREGIEDPLDDLGMVQQQLEQLAVIGRCEYLKTCTLLVQLLDQTARAYQEALATSSSPSMKLSIQEGLKIITKNALFPI